MKLHLSRTLGLVALNIAGITSFNDRPTLFFNLPAGAPIDRYSFRAMVSTSPDDYVAALSADARPMLIVVGMNDEAFVASKFTDVVRHHRNGTAVLIERETHDSITRSPRAFDAIERWMRALPRRSPASTRSTQARIVGLYEAATEFAAPISVRVLTGENNATIRFQAR